MAKLIGDLEPVFVIGVGWHRYQRMTESSYAGLALKAIRDALGDAGIDWDDVDETYFSANHLGIASGQPVLKYLGSHGKPVVHIENASASGSAAFRQGCISVASGMNDVALVIGADRPKPHPREAARIPTLAGNAVSFPTIFALLANEYIAQYGVSGEDIAHVAVKNHANGALNPNAQRQKVRTLEEVMGSNPIAGTLTALQCTPVGEGAAAVIIASEAAINRLGIDTGKLVRVASSVGVSEVYGATDKEIAERSIRRVLAEAQVSPENLDVVELHDAFTIEEALYTEASGICAFGEFFPMLKDGEFDIGGRCAINPSGGLIAMGHPGAPTGVGQIGEVTLQLRGEAGARQQKGAKIGLAHIVGLGAVGYGHVLVKP